MGNGAVAQVLLKCEKGSVNLLKPWGFRVQRPAFVLPEIRSRDRRIPEVHCLVRRAKCKGALDSLSENKSGKTIEEGPNMNYSPHGADTCMSTLMCIHTKN